MAGLAGCDLDANAVGRRRDFGDEGVTGFQPGDIIREINGAAIRTKRDFDAALKRAETTPPATWRLATERNGQRIESELRGRI